MRKGQALVILLGVWLALSPWIGVYARHAHATQDTIVGILVVLAGIASAVVGLTSSVPLWIALALGVWTFATPMMFNQAGPSFSADNDLIIGPLIGLAASVALVSRLRTLQLLGPPDPDGARGQTSL